MKSVHANPPEKICRLCLSDSGVILPIFEGEIAERFSVPLPQKILSCLAIKVCADDPLPPHICHRCLYEVDRFHEFRETCKRTNTTFNKICNNSGESVPFDVNQVLEIKQELHDESVYHDAISDLLSDEESTDVGSSRTRKRNRCASLLESMKRLQQAQSAASVTTTPAEQIPAEWIEQSKTTPPSESTGAPSHIRPQLECRFCAKPFIYESTLLEHEELHAKGVVSEDNIEPLEQPAESSLHEAIQDTGLDPGDAAGAETLQIVQQVQEVHNPANEQEACHPSPNQDQGIGTTVETVSLTDVTAMLLEGAFEGVRPINNESLLCRYCQEQLSNPDLLRRHERMYCNRKPSLIKQKQLIPHHQIQQQPQTSHQTPTEPPLCPEQTHTQDSQPQQQQHTHILIVQHPHEPQRHQAEQQTTFNEKGAGEMKSNEISRSCKHCHKDFIHRGSLWRHQMFCDSNPDRDVNRMVAGTKKKSAVMKSSDLGSNSQGQLSHGMPLPNSASGVAGSQVRRGGIQTNSGPFKCKFCEKRFLHRGSWWRHQKMFCSVNPEIPTVKAESKVRNQQEIPSFACRYCDRTFVHRGSCWHHEQTHTGVKEHACRYCSKTFNEKSRVARHERMHLGIKPFSCRQCGKAFCDASNLRNHELIHGDRASFLCAWCGKSYTRRALLLKHEQVHAGEGQIFSCTSCPRTFPDPDSLNEHTSIHSQEKRRVFLCPVCGQTFRSQTLLSQHNQHAHMNVREPHIPQPQQVQHHIQQTSQVHPEQEQQHHSCAICNKIFSDLSSLRHHELLHSSTPRQYQCSDTACNAVFHQQSQLDAHILLHEGEKTLAVQTSVAAAVPTTDFNQHQHPHQHHHEHQQQQQLLGTHELQHQQTVQHHELLHREGTYVIEGQDMSGQTIAVHHLVTQLTQ